jgi:hypothetical protein
MNGLTAAMDLAAERLRFSKDAQSRAAKQKDLFVDDAPAEKAEKNEPHPLTAAVDKAFQKSMFHGIGSDDLPGPQDLFDVDGPEEDIRFSALTAAFERLCFAAGWDERKHPRGQPNNAGEFGPGGNGKKASSAKTLAKPKSVDRPKEKPTNELKLKPARKGERAFSGEPTPLKTQLAKHESGAIGEAVVVAWLKSLGKKDARHLNLDRNNFPIDLIQDHASIEVKTGLVSNGADAQKWRLTIGEPGKAEKEWLAKASDKQKAAWNSRKQQAIAERKKKCLANLKKELGHTIKAKTVTVLLNPDTHTADIYEFDGWHDIIRWRSEEAKKAYKGTVHYGQR